MLIKTAMYPMHRKRLDKSAEGGKLYQIFVEKDCEFKPSQYNNLFDSLYTIYNTKSPYSWLTFEFRGTQAGISLYAWLSADITQEFLQSNINSVHPSAEVVLVNDYTKLHRFKTTSTSCGLLELDSHYLFNLLQSDGERGGADMIASLCASMQNLDDSEEVWVQYTLRPIHYRALSIATGHYEIYKKTGKRPSKLHQPYAKYTGILESPKALAGAVKYTIMGSSGTKEHNTSLSSIQRKLEAGVYFDLEIRLVATHPSFEKSRARLSTVISAFAPATDKNRFRPYTNIREKYKQTTKHPWLKMFNTTQVTKFLQDYATRKINVYPVENYVTPAELATLLHFPSKNIPSVIRLRAKKMPVPDGISQYNTIKEAWDDNAIVFGVSNFRGRRKYLAFKDIKMLMQHLYCIGGTGSGKSYWLSFLALQAVRHCGLTFFDVKGDVADDFMAHLPKSEWHRVHYIDLQDLVMFLPLNFLRQENMSVYNLATMIVSVFLKLNSEGSIKEHSQSILRRALIAVISTNTEGSILEVYRMFTDEEYLDWTLAIMRKHTDFPDVLAYWNSYKGMKVKARQMEAKAILNKLEIITQNELPRYSMCQRENLYNWRELMDSKSIIIINFAQDKNEKEIITFFGTLFTAFISRATFSRGDIPVDERVPHILILDEFEMFIDQDEDMKKFLEMARSYGLGLVLSHQSVEQIPASLMGMIEDNTFTQISLLIGTSSAPKIKHMLPGVSEEDLTSMVQYTGYGRFKKIHPNPFTFDSLDMNDYFITTKASEVTRWKNDYKKAHYKHINTIKGDIQERYGLTEKNQITDEDSASVRTGRATGKIRRVK
jgi:hypothetical protein